MTLSDNIFPGKQQVVFLFTLRTPLKRKQELRDLVIRHGATVSYIITKKTDVVIAESADISLDNYKVRQALKKDIPVVGLQYLDHCIQQGKFLDPSRYTVIAPVQKDEKFDKGQIRASVSKQAVYKKSLFRPETMPVYEPQDNMCPHFALPVLVKAALFEKKEDEVQLFAVLELQKSGEWNEKYMFRISAHTARNKEGELELSSTKYRFAKDANSALSVYAHLYNKYISTGYCRVQRSPGNVISLLGSDLFQEWFQQNAYSSSVDHQVAQVVETMWLEAVGLLEEKIAIPVSHLKLSEVEKAETVLRCLKEALKSKNNNSSIKSLKTKYYKHLPHQAHHKSDLSTLKDIVIEQDLCQVIKDVIAISESTDWSPKVSALSKYNALHCYIESLSEDDKDFAKVSALVYSSDESSKLLKIHNVFRLSRPTEQKQLLDLPNKQLMFHGSKIQNYVGLLSRGLLLPKTVTEDFGVDRSDPGMLGAGIYFSDSARTSLKYTSCSNVRGTRFLVVCDVALGDVFHTTKRMLDLKSAPDGYDSVHGVKTSTTDKTDFEDDEYVIYSICQQCIRYLVEIGLPGEEDPRNIPVVLTESEPPTAEADDLEDMTKLDIKDIKDIPSTLSQVGVGLCDDANKKIPLKAVHIRAKLVDLAAEVVVLQQYFNNNYSAIEAKYVFPLDDNAAVCGFEAFINGKHIIGKVKEKEEAHTEYREAISRGHGAYLMDEEKPDVFTVRVGNLPPKASVLIKITYVAELQVHGELIDFYLPGSMAAWHKYVALSEVIQTDVEEVNITKSDVTTTVQVAMEMPFNIRAISSPTHKINMKKTATKAVVGLPNNAKLGQFGFRLLIELAQIHVPRMWVEKHPENDSQACMLTFYPEFDAEDVADPEIVFLVDCSNSMKGEAMKQAKKLVLLALEMLPRMCHFNVVAFGTTYRELYQKPASVTDKAVKEASNFVKSLSATQGNTNIWSPVEMLSQLPLETNPRNIYLVSDGHLSHVDSLLKVINNNKMVNRIFTLSVGSVADLYVMKTVAKIGSGTSQYYDPSRKSKWQSMLQDQLQKAAQPCLMSIRVEWQQLDDSCEKPVQAPRALMALYNGQREVIYGFIQHCTMAVLKAELCGREVSTLVSTHELNITTGKILHTLTARAVIHDWQNGILASDKIENQMIKLSSERDIIELSKKYSLVTSFTSFVAIEERTKGEIAEKGPSIDDLISKEKVDILDYMDWQVKVTEEKPVDEKALDLLEKAAIVESYSVTEATKLYGELKNMLPELLVLDKDVSGIIDMVQRRFSAFYKDVKGDDAITKICEPHLLRSSRQVRFGTAMIAAPPAVQQMLRKSKENFPVEKGITSAVVQSLAEKLSSDLRSRSTRPLHPVGEPALFGTRTPSDYGRLPHMAQREAFFASSQDVEQMAGFPQAAQPQVTRKKPLLFQQPQQLFSPAVAQMAPPPPLPQKAPPLLLSQKAHTPPLSQKAPPPLSQKAPPPPVTQEVPPPLMQQKIPPPPLPQKAPPPPLSQKAPPPPVIQEVPPPLLQQKIPPPPLPPKAPPPPLSQKAPPPHLPQRARPLPRPRKAPPLLLPQKAHTPPLSQKAPPPPGAQEVPPPLLQQKVPSPLVAPNERAAGTRSLFEFDYLGVDVGSGCYGEYKGISVYSDKKKVIVSGGKEMAIFGSEESTEKLEEECYYEELGSDSDEMYYLDNIQCDLVELNGIPKEKSQLFQHLEIGDPLHSLQMTMEQTSYTTAGLTNDRVKYGQSTSHNIWTSVMLSSRSLSKNSNLDPLFKLKKGVYWCPSEELGKLIGVNFDLCKEVLLKAGLRSLGVKAEMEVMCYVSTLLVMLSIVCLQSDISSKELARFIELNLNVTDIEFKECVDGIVITMKSTGEALLHVRPTPECFHLDESMAWLREQDKRYPTLATMLELSGTRVTRVLQMMEALLTVEGPV